MLIALQLVYSTAQESETVSLYFITHSPHRKQPQIKVLDLNESIFNAIKIILGLVVF
jgi:hypothetical protein